MLRADNVICGTSTTGTGTLTLAACPAPPGGLDFDKWLKATGFNFVSTNAVLVSYTIIEYTSSAFTTAKQTEKGVGTLTLGASITAATLARTTVQSISTGLDTSTPAPTFAAPTAITIGTAANTLVFVGPSTSEIMAFEPYVITTSLGSDKIVCPPGANNAIGAFGVTNNDFYYTLFTWPFPMLVKRATMWLQNAMTGGTSNVWCRLYAVGTDGLAGKLLYDFGLLGTSNASLTVGGAVATAASGNGFYLIPGEYYFCAAVTLSGGTGTPNFFGSQTYFRSGRLGSAFNFTNGVAGASYYRSAGTPTVTPDDPAVNTTSGSDGSPAFGFGFTSS